MNSDETTCPDCAETIKAAAKVCRHCGYRLTTSMPDAPAPAPAPAPLDKVEASRGNPKAALIVVVCTVAFLFAMVLNVANNSGRAAPDAAVSINDTAANAVAASEAADAAMNAALARADAVSSSPSLSKTDLARVCRAAIARVMGKEPSIMKVKSNSDGMVRIQYTRPDDGTVWKDDCRLEGQRVIWRAVDATPGAGAGRWRNQEADGVLTYSIDGSTVRIGEKYSDGTYDASSFTIAK